MKKIFTIFICVAVIWVCSIACLAADTGIISENVTEGLVTENSDNKGTAPVGEHTLFSRVWECLIEHKTEALGVGGDAILIIVSIIIKLRNDKKTKGISDDLKAVKGDASATSISQNSVVNVVNQLIDGYNGMHNSYEKYGLTEANRNKLIGAVMVQNTALLEILTTVYVNNKNLPQGVKDLVNLKYANTLKTLGDDQTLIAIVEAVREKICVVESEKVDTAEIVEQAEV